MAEVDQFALARKRAQQQANVSSQTQKGALERRFAQLGSLDSGARIKLESQVDQQTAQQLQDANEGINAQEQQETQRRREIAEGRQFSKSEREASQGFASGEADKGRSFATSERLGSQGFASGEARLGREFSTSERLGSQGFASGEADKGRSFATSERLGSQGFASTEAAKGRTFATSERLSSQGFSTREREAGQGFASTEAQKGRDFTSGQADIDRKESGRRFDEQSKTQKDQFDRTFAEEKFVNEANINFNRQQIGDESGIPDLFDEIQKRKGTGKTWATRNGPTPAPAYGRTYGRSSDFEDTIGGF